MISKTLPLLIAVRSVQSSIKSAKVESQDLSVVSPGFTPLLNSTSQFKLQTKICSSHWFWSFFLGMKDSHPVCKNKSHWQKQSAFVSAAPHQQVEGELDRRQACGGSRSPPCSTSSHAPAPAPTPVSTSTAKPPTCTAAWDHWNSRFRHSSMVRAIWQGNQFRTYVLINLWWTEVIVRNKACCLLLPCTFACI